MTGFAPWLLPFINSVPQIAIDVDELCDRGPLTLPDWTAPLLIALGTFGTRSVQVGVAIEQLTDWLTHALWYLACECDAGGTPDIESPPTPPSDVPSYSLPSAPSSGGYLAEVLADNPVDYWRLADPEQGYFASVGSARGDGYASNSASMLSGFTGVSSDGAAMFGATHYPVFKSSQGSSSNWTAECWQWFGYQLVARESAMSFGINGSNGSVTFAPATDWILNTATTVIGPNSYNVEFAKWYHIVMTVSGTSWKLYINGSLVASGTASNVVRHRDFRVTQNGTISGARFFTEFAYYDTALSQSRIQAHYDAADTKTAKPVLKFQSSVVPVDDAIKTLLMLIQRQEVPFGYVASATHTSLSGSGEIEVQGLIGYRFVATTVPAWTGAAAGDPTRLFDLGWTHWGTADGFIDGQRLRLANQLIFPKAMGAMTKIGYSLESGVEAAITELVRES